MYSTAATVSGDISSDNTGGVSAEVASAVDELPVPDGVEVLIGGVAGDIEEGFTNMIIPTNAVLMGVIALAGVPWTQWARWVLPLQVVLFVVGLMALFVAVSVGYGR